MLYMIVPKSFGFAGTKDKRAITTQRVQALFLEKKTLILILACKSYLAFSCIRFLLRFAKLKALYAPGYNI